MLPSYRPCVRVPSRCSASHQSLVCSIFSFHFIWETKSVRHTYMYLYIYIFLGIDSCRCGGLASLKFVGQASRLQTQAGFLLHSWGRITSPGSLRFSSQGLHLIEWVPCTLSRIISFPESQLSVDVNHIYRIPSQQRLVFDHATGHRSLAKWTM